MLRKLLLHISRYSLGSLLTSLASAVTFPFLTRIFTVADYGLMNLLSITLAALVSVGKLGLQHSVVRFVGQIHPRANRGETARYVSTAILGMSGAGAIVGLAWLGAVVVVPVRWLGDTRGRVLFGLLSALVLIQTSESALTNLLRAWQRSGQLNVYLVVKKYAGLILMILALLFIRRDLLTFYSAQIVAESVAAVLLVAVIFRKDSSLPRPNLGAFSAPLYKDMVAYGLPMMLGWELSGLILSLGDRYVIHALLGPTPLGIYSAAYNLSQFVEVVTLTPWGLAILPIYVRLWDESGRDRTTDFLARSLRVYALIGIPIVAGLTAVGPELITVLASGKYRSGASIIPPVIAGLVVSGAIPIAAAGVFVQKRTWLVARHVFLSALLNLGLNAALIPKIGVQGAALATLASYVVLFVWMTRSGSESLPIPMPWGLLARSSISAVLMYGIVCRLHLSGDIGTLALKTGTGVAAYSALIFFLEPTARRSLSALLTEARGLRK